MSVTPAVSSGEFGTREAEKAPPTGRSRHPEEKPPPDGQQGTGPAGGRPAGG